MSNFSAELGDVNEKFRKVLDEKFDRFEEVIRQCLNEAKQEGELRADSDTELLSGFILNAWHGALVRMKSTGNTKPLNDFKTIIFNMLKN